MKRERDLPPVGISPLSSAEPGGHNGQLSMTGQEQNPTRKFTGSSPGPVVPKTRVLWARERPEPNVGSENPQGTPQLTAGSQGLAWASGES